MTNAEKVWWLYKIAKEGQTTTIRSGCGLHGIYPYDKNHPHDFTRSESDAEHVFGCIMLAMNVMEIFPYLIPVERRYEVIRCLAVHELGENDTGDVPDDGARDNAKKDADEYEYVRNYLSCWDITSAGAGGDLIYPQCMKSVSAQQILKVFREMQEKSTELGRFIYCVDKTEAILQNLIYETQGRTGSFEGKKKFVKEMSERDRMEVEATKSDKVADNWAYGFYDRCRNIEYFDIFFSIIRAAAKDVRGEDFNWLPPDET